MDDFSWFDPEPLCLALGPVAEKLELNANKNMDAKRAEYVVNFAKSGISTVSSIAELPPCRTESEVLERGELILSRRRDVMRALGCDPVFDPKADAPVEKRNRIPQFNRSASVIFERARTASRDIKSRSGNGAHDSFGQRLNKR